MNPRKTVYTLLLRMEKGAYSPILLNNALSEKNIIQRDKAFITALFYGVIERKLTIDYVIAKHAAKKPDTETLVILRMALYQIMYMNSVPDSAAVNEAVNLAPSRSKGYVNAILRNILREKTSPKFDGLSVEYSCPQWLIDKWTSEYGAENTLQILQTSLQKPPIFERNGYIQDESSYKACVLLAPKEGETILDLCAAPGGKSFTLARLMENTGRIISCDINKNKLALVERTARKLGFSIIETRVNDGKVFNSALPKADRVLCDVPCSGLGVIRRKPEIKYKSESEFEKLPQIQLQILKTSANYVKDGGFLMYSTCTLSKAENDDVVSAFANGNSDFELIEKKTSFPEKNGGDGFFAALFCKPV